MKAIVAVDCGEGEKCGELKLVSEVRRDHTVIKTNSEEKEG